MAKQQPSSTIETLESLPLSSLRFDGDTQCREKPIDEDHVNDLFSLFPEDNPVWDKDLLPPAKACRDDSGNVWVWDGFHSCEAAKRAGCVNAWVIVRPGTKEEAQWLACGANKEHKALKRQPGDVAKAIRLAFAIKPNSTQEEVARHVGCHRSYVAEHDPRRKPRENKDGGRRKLSTVDNSAPRPSEIIPGWALEDEEDERAVTESAEPAVNDAPERGTDEGEAAPAIQLASDADCRVGEEQPYASLPIVRDELGLPIRSQASVEAFQALDLFDEAGRLCAQLAKVIDEIGKSKGGELLRAHYLKLKCHTRDGEQIERLHSIDLDNLRAELKHWRPFASICPKCGDNPSDKCAYCYGLPYLNEAAWNQCPEKLRKAITGNAEAPAPAA